MSDTNIVPQPKAPKAYLNVLINAALARRIKVLAAERGIRPNVIAEAAFQAFLDSQAGSSNKAA